MDTTIKSFSSKAWTLWTFAGWVLGVIFILNLSGILDWFGIEGYQFYLGLGMATGVGLGQWFALRKTAPVSPLWIVYSALGMGIPFIILDLMPTGSIPYKLPSSIVIGSLTAGLLQYLLLKKQFDKASLWIIGSLIGWSIAVATAFIINLTMMIKVTGYMNLVMAFANLLLILAGGLVLGLITSIAIAKAAAKD